MARRVLYYALGGGLGHATRTIALARQLARLDGGEHRLLCNSPFTAAIRRLLESERHITARLLATDITPADAQQAVREELAAFQPAWWIVDTFPRGLGGELPPLLEATPTLRKILVGRGLPDAYVRQFQLRDFVTKNYATVVIPGERSPWSDLCGAVPCAPFVIRDANELLTRSAAARALQVDPGIGCICVVGSGSRDECERLLAVTGALRHRWRESWPPLRIALPTGRTPPYVDHVPFIEWFGAVRLLVGFGGYNLVQETRATGVPALFAAQPRTYDDQAARLARRSSDQDQAIEGGWHLPPAADAGDDAIVASAVNLAERIEAQLRGPWTEWKPEFENGARQAAEWLVRESGVT